MQKEGQEEKMSQRSRKGSEDSAKVEYEVQRFESEKDFVTKMEKEDLEELRK